MKIKRNMLMKYQDGNVVNNNDGDPITPEQLALVKKVLSNQYAIDYFPKSLFDLVSKRPDLLSEKELWDLNYVSEQFEKGDGNLGNIWLRDIFWEAFKRELKERGEDVPKGWDNYTLTSRPDEVNSLISGTQEPTQDQDLNNKITPTDKNVLTDNNTVGVPRNRGLSSFRAHLTAILVTEENMSWDEAEALANGLSDDELKVVYKMDEQGRSPLTDSAPDRGAAYEELVIRAKSVKNNTGDLDITPTEVNNQEVKPTGENVLTNGTTGNNAVTEIPQVTSDDTDVNPEDIGDIDEMRNQVLNQLIGEGMDLPTALGVMREMSDEDVISTIEQDYVTSPDGEVTPQIVNETGQNKLQTEDVDFNVNEISEQDVINQDNTNERPYNELFGQMPQGYPTQEQLDDLESRVPLYSAPQSDQNQVRQQEGNRPFIDLKNIKMPDFLQKGIDKIKEGMANRKARKDKYNDIYSDEQGELKQLTEDIRDARANKNALQKEQRLDRRVPRRERLKNKLANRISLLTSENPRSEEFATGKGVYQMAVDDYKNQQDISQMKGKWATKGSNMTKRLAEKIAKTSGEADREPYIQAERTRQADANRELDATKSRNKEIKRAENKAMNLIKQQSNFNKRMAKKIEKNPDLKNALQYFQHPTDETMLYDPTTETDRFKRRGGYLPKAQTGLQLATDDTKHGEELITNMNSGDPLMRGSYFSIPSDQKNKFTQNQRDVIANWDYYSPGTERNKLINSKQVVQPEVSNFDNTRLNVYGNRLQDIGSAIPAISNLSKFVAGAPKRMKKIMPDFEYKRKVINANTQPAARAFNQLSTNLKRNIRGTGQLAANMTEAAANRAAQAQDAAHKAKVQQLTFDSDFENKKQAYANASAIEDRNIESLYKQEVGAWKDLGSEAATQAGKYFINKGVLHNSELQDFIKLETYVNQLSNDYKVVPTGNGGYKVVHTKTGGSMSVEDFDKLMETEKNRNYTTTKVDPYAGVNKSKTEVKKERQGGYTMKNKNRLYM